MSYPELDQAEGGIPGAGNLGRSAPNPLTFRANEAQGHGTEIHLVQAGPEMAAHWSIDVQLQETIADRVHPKRERLALINPIR